MTMRCINRQQFADLFNGFKAGLGDPDSPLWIADLPDKPSQYFICIPNQLNVDTSYHAWCREFLQGFVRCYSSSVDNGEWWGFTNERDIVMWTLKWVD